VNIRPVPHLQDHVVAAIDFVAPSDQQSRAGQRCLGKHA
jgi:hypothetical protein